MLWVRRVGGNVRVFSSERSEAGALGTDDSEWVFLARTRSGHIEKPSLKKQHLRALSLSKVEPFTRWVEHMNPYTLAYLAGRGDFATAKRYVHPQPETVRAAMERVHEAKRWA